MSNSLLEKFIKDYSNNTRETYKESSRLAAETCELVLKQKGIRSIITHREKDAGSLFNKISYKNKTKKYKSIASIYKDINDLGGVRIALYFPDDIRKVGELLSKHFDILEKKEFPLSSKLRRYKDYKKIFCGYKAEHFIVRHKAENLDKKKKLAGNKTEIQVASVLMHAWSEIEHDLIYKPTNGESSLEEKQILDEINGLALTGELALVRLQNAIERRLSGRKSFNNKYDLHIFLNKFLLNKYPKISSYNIGQVDYLFEFLKIAKLNNPADIEKYLNSIDFSSEISDQITGKILGDYPELSDKYKEAVENVKYGVVSTSKKYMESYAKLVTGWTELQRNISRHVNDINNITGNFKSNISQIQEQYSLVFKPDILKQLESITQVRNQIVHNFKQLPLKEINEANKKLLELSKEINEALKFIP